MDWRGSFMLVATAAAVVAAGCGVVVVLARLGARQRDLDEEWEPDDYDAELSDMP